MRAKFINTTEIQYAPNALEIAGEWILNPNADTLEANGYKVLNVGVVPPLGERETLTTTYADGIEITCNYTVNPDTRTTEQKRADYYNSNRERAEWIAAATNYLVTNQPAKLATVTALIENDNAICNAKYPY